MHLQSSLASLALAFTSTVVAQGSLPDIVAGDAAASATTVLGTASGGALDVAATRPTVGPSPLVAGGPLTIQIKNQYGSPLSIFYGSNAGAPTPVGNPGRGTLGSSTQVLFPSGWAGRITIGKNFDPKGTKIEASLVSNGGYRADVDVSYVDGYSVGITCSCQGKVVAGCNKPLYGLGNTCRSQGPAGVCYNAAVNSPNGPPPAFFAPCRGAAYTYPNDNGANSFGQCPNNLIQCCVGASCPANPRQPAKLRFARGAMAGSGA